MEINKIHIAGIIIFVLVIIFSFSLENQEYSFFIIGVGILIGVFPFIISVIKESKDNAEKEEMFLEFTRNLVESVKTGTPISKSIVNAKNKPYGVLSDNIKKLASQIELGIPLSAALIVFSKDVKNKTVSRTLTLIGQAEKAGGDIGEILESVAGAVTVSDKLKKERKAAISSLVVQGYIIFFVFMFIVLIMQFWVIPMLSGISETEITGISVGVSDINEQEISNSFLYLLLIQGFFSGLAIGKLSEGSSKAGIRHSFYLMLSSFLISTGAGIFLG